MVDNTETWEDDPTAVSSWNDCQLQEDVMFDQRNDNADEDREVLPLLKKLSLKEMKQRIEHVKHERLQNELNLKSIFLTTRLQCLGMGYMLSGAGISWILSQPDAPLQFRLHIIKKITGHFMEVDYSDKVIESMVYQEGRFHVEEELLKATTVPQVIVHEIIVPYWTYEINDPMNLDFIVPWISISFGRTFLARSNPWTPKRNHAYFK